MFFIMNPDQNRILTGFDHVNRFWNRQLDMEMVKILPGEYYVTSIDEVISTVLGSCISVCICDKKLGIGGMNHFMLPENKNGNRDEWQDMQTGRATRYGVDAMEHLVNDILKNGGRKNHFDIKVCGGGRMMENMSDVGKSNIQFIHDYLKKEGYKVTSEDTGDIYPRKVRYFPKTGQLQVKKLQSLHNDTIYKRENDYQSNLANASFTGEVELF